MAEKRTWGWLRQPIDPRDYYRYAPVSVALPTTFKLPAFEATEKAVIRLDQSSLGSCGPNTAAECILHNQLQQGLPDVVPSRLFMYWNTRYLMGRVNQDSGVDNRSMMKALASWGWCPESLWPYNIDTFRTKPNQAAYDAAKPNSKLVYSAIVQALSQMKGILYGTNGTDGDPFVLGFDVFPQMESDEAEQTGLLRTPSPSETPIGGHDVAVYGYSDEEQVFFFRNHWRRRDGSWWGLNGNGRIPYAYAASARWAGDFWTINAIPGGVPPTPPVPPVPPTPPTPPTASDRIITDVTLRKVIVPATGWSVERS